MSFPSKDLTLRRMLLREMWHSRWNTLACVFVVAAAIALYVAMADLGAASVDTTRVLMKEMGFNLRIIPATADPARYQALDFEGPDMPETHVAQLAGGKLILAQHFVGKLQHTLRVGEYTAVLTGVLGQSTRAGTVKDPMPTSYTVQQGQALLGAAVARGLNKKAGDTLTILDREFEIAKVLPEYGAIPEDIRVFVHLRDAQEMLKRPGRINAIDALACQCPADARDIVAMVRESIERTLPDVQVEPYYSLLLARHQQRILMARIQTAVIIAAIFIAAAALWGLTYQNVSGRRHEIAVLSALGFSDTHILALLLGKTLLYAPVAAAAGCVCGRAFTLYAGFAAEQAVLMPTKTLLMLLPLATAASMLFALPPVLTALLRDPADVLGETLP